MSKNLQDIFLGHMQAEMISRGLTLGQLAELIGVSGSLLSQIRSRHRNVGLNFVEKVADALDVEAFELLKPTPGVIADRRDMRYHAQEDAPALDAKKKRTRRK